MCVTQLGKDHEQLIYVLLVSDTAICQIIITYSQDILAVTYETFPHTEATMARSQSGCRGRISGFSE